MSGVPLTAGGRSNDWRRWPRVKLSIPVQLNRAGGGDSGAVPCGPGQSRNLSTGGVYVTTKVRDGFAPGEIIRVEIFIPWEARHTFPFSRIVGSCRVVRVDERPASGDGAKGLALEFCTHNITMLGAIVFP
jgi:hypothetical protein